MTRASGWMMTRGHKLQLRVEFQASCNGVAASQDIEGCVLQFSDLQILYICVCVSVE
jgi:hypothetical protein